MTTLLEAIGDHPTTPTQADDLLPPSIGRIVVVLVNAVHQQITVDMYSIGGIEPVNGAPR
jgi:hypothetical protein